MVHIEAEEVVTYKTLEYSWFKTIKENRPVLESWVVKLMESIVAIGFIYGRAIIVTTEGFIIDGQHTFEACKRLGLPIYYQVVKGDYTDIMIKLNTFTHKWQLAEFIDLWAGKGKEDYVRLKEFMVTHKVTANYALNILMGRPGGRDGLKYKAGDPFVANPKAEEIMKFLHDCKPYHNFSTKVNFTRAVTIIFSKVSEKKIAKLKRKIGAIPEQASTSDYLKLFENIINKGSHENERIHLII